MLREAGRFVKRLRCTATELQSCRRAAGGWAAARVPDVYHRTMPKLPVSFRAFVVDKPHGGAFSRGVRDFATADLPPGDVTIRVEWSSVNFKDGLAAREDGRVARSYPLIPGIDLAGVVVASEDPAFAAGQAVLANGYDIGVARHGGYGQLARLPSGWVVPMPAGMTAREAMAIGTAGFTAAMSVAALENQGLRAGDGPVLVTGASGGVGSMAVAMLAARGHEVWAATGKASEADRLARLGAAGFLTREEVTGAGRPLDTARWAGAVDTVGAATLPYVLRTLRIGAAVASSGNASGIELVTTVFPFILRGVALLGMDSGNMAIEPRRALWERLAGDLSPRSMLSDGESVAEVSLDTVETALDAIHAGQARGRWVVRL
jgi:acrylyl-CoA reductase (NADPH)